MLKRLLCLLGIHKDEAWKQIHYPTPDRFVFSITYSWKCTRCGRIREYER